MHVAQQCTSSRNWPTPSQVQEGKRKINGYKYAQECTKQLFAKRVPVTEWLGAKVLPSTPLLLHGLGMQEKLVTLGLPMVQCLSRLKGEHFAALEPPS